MYKELYFEQKVKITALQCSRFGLSLQGMSCEIEGWSKIVPIDRYLPVLCSVADPDPGSGTFLTPGSGIRPLFLRA
jgi:hypothetical protein